MDQAVLVKSGHTLVNELDKTGHPPQIAMWVHSPDTETWKLWIVPSNDLASDKHAFYRVVAQTISKLRRELGDFSASDVEMASMSHPAMKGIASFINAPGLIEARFSGNQFNGFYLPDGIVLRSDVTAH